MNTENNKIIAEFMGYKKSIANTWFKGNKIVQTTSFKYDSDWNWLMEVVEKIEQTTITETYGQFNENKVEAKVSVSIENTFCQILSNGMYLNEIVSIDGETKIQAVYNACLYFINWYNLNKE